MLRSGDDLGELNHISRVDRSSFSTGAEGGEKEGAMAAWFVDSPEKG